MIIFGGTFSDCLGDIQLWTYNTGQCCVSQLVFASLFACVLETVWQQCTECPLNVHSVALSADSTDSLAGMASCLKAFQDRSRHSCILG